MKRQQPKYYIWTIGCQMNEADSRRLAAELEGLGYAATDNVKTADVVVLNTCVVRQQAENKIYGRLGSLKPLKGKRSDVTIGLMGCLVGVDETAGLRERFPYVDVFMPPSDTQPMLDYLTGQTKSDDDIDTIHGCFLPPSIEGMAVTANVPVILGCSHACSYCIIPARRGPDKSREPDAIVEEVTKLAGRGIHEIMLLGQIVDRYGRDLDEDVDLADLLLRLQDIDDIYRIRIVTNHPNYMTDKLIDAMADLPKVCPHVELPIQAGSDAVLKAMRRGYTTKKYLQLIDAIRQRMPDAAINTDIIVGFCGETEEQFMETHRIMKTVRFDKVHIAKYSPRPGTHAARKLTDDVPADEKERRRKMLDDLQKEILTEKGSALLGEELEVLVEERQKGRWRGRSPHNRLVFFDDERDLRGRLIPVHIEHTSPYSLIGRAVDREATESYTNT